MKTTMNATSASHQDEDQSSPAHWKSIVARYQEPDLKRGLWQLANTLGPMAGLWYLMHLSLAVSWWLTIPLALLSGAFLVRLFIIHHDCGHGSFFRSARANHVLGFITGVLTFTPYHHWRWEHAAHHATASDLDRRGAGDIWTITVEEYRVLPRKDRIAYHVGRNPIFLFLLAPLIVSLIKHRFPRSDARPRERASVHWTNLAIVVMAIGLSLVFGLVNYLIIQSTILMAAGSVGFWLFYVQHQFEGTYWERSENWDYVTAALQGSSYYKLPKVLQWFSGNIGFHHIHHLSARIPNYNLENCHNAEPLFAQVTPITLRSSLKSLSFRLWDEQERKLVGFKAIENVRRSAQ